MFPSVLKRIRRHLLAVAAGCDACCDACCVLQCPSDSRVWPPVCCPNKGTIVNALVAQVWGFVPVVRQFSIKTLPALRHLEPLLHWERLHTHTSGAALRPGTAAEVKRSVGLDCVAVSPLGSVVMPGSASLNPPKTA